MLSAGTARFGLGQSCPRRGLALRLVAVTPRYAARGGSMLRRLLRDESGQTMLEYIVIVVFVVIAAMLAFKLISAIVNRSAESIDESFNVAIP